MCMTEFKKPLKKVNFKEYNVIIYNDPMHGLDFVKEVITETIPSISEDEAIKHAYLVHTQQKAIIYSGLKEHCEHYQYLIENFRPEEKDGKLLVPLAVDVVKNIKTIPT